MPTFRFYNVRTGSTTGAWVEMAMEDDIFSQREPCRCSKSALRDGCNAKWGVMDYGPLCRALGFDPWLPLLFENSDYYFPILYPWDEYPPGVAAPPGRPESAFGVRSDYDTKENHFGWVDHTHAVVAIPMHRYYPLSIGMCQPIVLGDLGDHCVPAKPIISVHLD